MIPAVINIAATKRRIVSAIAARESPPVTLVSRLAMLVTLLVMPLVTLRVMLLVMLVMQRASRHANRAEVIEASRSASATLRTLVDRLLRLGSPASLVMRRVRALASPTRAASR